MISTVPWTDRRKSTSTNLSRSWASRLSTLKRDFATWWITILVALRLLPTSRSASPTATIAKSSSLSTSNTSSYMSRQEHELREEHRKFNDLMVVYLKLQKVVRMHKDHPAWFVPNNIGAFELRACDIWDELQTTIPTTFLIELQETVNERHIMLNNQIPSL